MNIDGLIQQSGAWRTPDSEQKIVISSRIRLARNLRDYAFPGWGGAEECDRIWRDLSPRLCDDVPSLKPALCIGMDELDELDRQILTERHLISREQAEKGKGSGLILKKDETVSIMVNEEDHLRLQMLVPGLELKDVWKRIDALDSEIEQIVPYAFSPRLGYLTSCPTNVGTGMRASVMLHLPGLVLMNEINPIIKGMGKIGLAVRGLWGEGTESSGNMFQISNQMTLGEKEIDLVENIEQIAQEIIEHEKNARTRLMESRERFLRDHVGRAVGILSNAHLLSSNEALDLLSGLRLGVDLGIVKDVGRAVIDDLMVVAQPAHLQKFEGKVLKPKERDWYRAERIRKGLTKRRTTRTRGKKDHE